MRIIAGQAGRTAIRVPSEVTRPTTDFVRQALFSILGERVHGARVLDLFAGSGALGLEALSRGAASCTFVDDHRQSTTVIAENLKKARLEGGMTIRAEAAHFLRRDSGTYDLIFADPPYWKYHGDKDHISDLLKTGSLPPRLAANAWLIVEISSNQASPVHDSLTLITRREYGNCAILIYQAALAAATVSDADKPS